MVSLITLFNAVEHWLFQTTDCLIHILSPDAQDIIVSYYDYKGRFQVL